jgi:hypothetical protein
MKTKFMPWLCVLCLCPAFSPVLWGQSYRLDWQKIAGGGGTSTGGVYSVSGTIGQPDASVTLTGGSYSLTGGFWSLYAVQTAGLPNLAITYASGSAKVFWPNTATCTLQQTADLTAGSWVNSSYAIATQNGTNSITLASPAGKLFFRLKQ